MENSSHCIVNSEEVRDYAERFQRGHWSFFGLGRKVVWGRILINQKENVTIKPIRRLNTLQTVAMPCSEVQVRSTDESLNTYDTPLAGIRKHLNFCFAQFHSANQLSIYGAVPSWCGESAERVMSKLNRCLGRHPMGVDKSMSKVGEQ